MKGVFCMHKTLMLVLVVLLSAAWLQAQDNMGKSSGSTSPTTIEGCLQYVNGHYSLVDSGGITHPLSGYANKLKDHVGHTVEITGTTGVKTTGTTMQGAASTAKQQPVLKVSGVRHIADTCTTK
jgi:hypothetical protein